MNNRIKTTEEYWDCECEYSYIHPKTEIVCDTCKAHQDDQPDSRVDEVNEDVPKMSFCELEKAILNYDAKSEYQQVAIVMLRTIFENNKGDRIC